MPLISKIGLRALLIAALGAEAWSAGADEFDLLRYCQQPKDNAGRR